MKIIRNNTISKQQMYTVRILMLVFFLGSLIFSSIFLKAYYISLLFFIPLLLILFKKSSYQINHELITCNVIKWLGMIFGSQIAMYSIIFGISGLSSQIALPPFLHGVTGSNTLQQILQIPLFPWPYVAALVTLLLAYIPRLPENGSVFEMLQAQLKSTSIITLFTYGVHQRYDAYIATFTILSLSSILFLLLGHKLLIFSNIFILIPIWLILIFILKDNRLHTYLNKHAKKNSLSFQVMLITIATAIIFSFSIIILKLLPSNLGILNFDFFTHFIQKITPITQSHAWLLICYSLMLCLGAHLSFFYIRISQGKRIISVAIALLILPVIFFLLTKTTQINFQLLTSFNPIIYCACIVLGSALLFRITLQKQYRWNNSLRLQINTLQNPKHRSPFALIQNICKVYPLNFIVLILFGLGITAAYYAMFSLLILASLPTLTYLAIKN